MLAEIEAVDRRKLLEQCLLIIRRYKFSDSPLPPVTAPGSAAASATGGYR